MSFSWSKVNEMYLPASLKELKEGWCCGMTCLNLIVISPSNNKFIFKDDKYLLCKSDENNDEYDIFLFASRDIDEIQIPSNIKVISSYAFEFCENLTKVIIQKNSDLQTIGENAFNFCTKIKEIFIPPKVSKICEKTFDACFELKKVEITTNSNLQIIEKNAFSSSKIKEIYLPASLKELKEGWCNQTSKLSKIVISPSNDKFIFKDDKYLLCKSDENNDEYDIFLFASRDIDEIQIPSNIKVISSYAFEFCKNLTKVEIQENSDLQTIGTDAFSKSKIKEIYLPASLKELKEGWCCETSELSKIVVSPSNDKFIFKDDKYLLCKSDANNDEYDIFLFANRDIDEIQIPSNIKVISPPAFEFCEKLTKIEIPKDLPFSWSEIKNIFSRSSISKRYRCSFFENMVTLEANDVTLSSKELKIFPLIDIPIDCSSILSFSIYKKHTITITKDHKSLNDGFKIKDFDEYKIKDHDGNVYFPISAFTCFCYDLYMVSEAEKSIKTRLVKNNSFLNIGKFNPVAIYCGSTNCAAIDLKGAILYIPGSYDYESSKYIEPKYLPNNEKAVDIACLSDFLYALSSNGKLYMSKNANTSNIVFNHVEQFKDIDIIQISGIYKHILVLTEEGKVYSKGQNFSGELGTGDEKNILNKFVQISSLNQYKITAVSAGAHHSLFLTSEGKVLACGDNIYNQCFSDQNINSYLLPIETSIQKGAEFCISSNNSAAICIGFDPEMSPNRRVKDEIYILLLGCKEKTQILQAFVNNNFDNSFNENNENEDFIVNLEIHKKVIKLKLIDAKNMNERKQYYQRASNFMYFFDNSNQSSSFNELNQIYEEASQIWDNYLKFVIVNYNNSNSSSSKLKYNEIENKYKCEIFEVGLDKNMKNIDKPFFSFLPKIYKNQNEIFKIGKEYRNPFDNINRDHINIGLFGSKNVNKTELAFRYIYDDLYKDFYDDFIGNFTDNNLNKIVECKNNYLNVSILDSTFAKNNDDNFRSCYSAVQGIVLVFQVDLLSSSSSDFFDEINQFYKNAKNSVESELNLIIAFKVDGNNQINDLYQRFYEKINEIEQRFQCNAFLYQIENGINVEDLFYCLIKKIIQNKKVPSLKRKKHKKHKKSKRVK